MKITMRTLSAGPAGILEARKTYEVEDRFARVLVAGGYAIPAGKPVPAAAPAIEVPTEVETTMAAPSAEKAVSRRGKVLKGRSRKG